MSKSVYYQLNLTKLLFHVIIFIYFHIKEGEAIFSLKSIKNHMLEIILILLCISAVTFTLLSQKKITVVINGKPQKIITFRSTVKSTLDSKKIVLGAKDKIWPSINSRIHSNETINIKRAVNVNITVDGKIISLLSSEDNISSLFKTEGISLGTNDKVKPSLNTSLSQGMNIQIVRVTTKVIAETKPIDFKTVVKYDSSIPNTQRKTVQDGSKGETTIQNDVTYEDGKEVSRKAINQSVTKNPSDKIVVAGTYPLMPVSRGGDPVPYAKTINMRATAYYATSGIGKTYTASGRKAVRDPDGYSTIAVDPSVIPLGTKLFVEGYGFAIAAETGTGVTGNHIDVFFDTYSEACNWAVKYVNVYILK